MRKSSVASSTILQVRVAWYRYNNRRHSYSDVIVRETIMSYVVIATVIRRVIYTILFREADYLPGSPIVIKELDKEVY